MKKLFFIILCLGLLYQSIAQEAVQNIGNLKIHDTGAVGFHHDFINNGFTDDNEGVVGFFSDDNIIISGAFKPIFKDLEIMVTNDLFLEVSVGVTNNSNFISGNIITPRNQVDINIEYAQNAFYNGNTNAAKVDGYAAISNKTSFIFPIGYNDVLRPLSIQSPTLIMNAKSAYFFENPNTPLTFIQNFDTQTHDDILSIINDKEFWDVDSETPSQIQLTWNEESQIENLVAEVKNLRVVGWHTQNKKWEDLGNTSFKGDFTSGFITSDTFIPDNYTIVTLGGNLNKNNTNLANYLITVNNDGINDFLVIKEVTLSPNNILNIYNRWGRAVYTEENYTNLFEGKANTNTFIGKDRVLPAGVYFYVIELFDIDVTHQGYLYINE